jgi:adenine-specific DNA methylase
MNKKIYEALPPMLGGKRRMVEVISSHFYGKSLCDLFMGGASVSIKAKSMGMQIIGNDIAYRSYLIGEALVKNQKEKITDEDVYSLFVPTENNHLIEQNFSPEVFTPEFAKFLDNGFTNARKRTAPKKQLLELALVKLILSTRQFGGFQVGKQDNEMIANNQERELLELASEARGKKIKNILSHPLPTLMRIKDQINSGIFDNGQANEIFQLDAFELLKKLKKENRRVGTLYLDSPYKNSVLYSSHYKILDQILEQKVDIKIEDKAFNKADALASFEKLFALASDVSDKWIISLGYNPDSDGGIKGEELLAVVRKFKPADIFYLEHIWAINNLSGKKQNRNVEYLIVTN